MRALERMSEAFNAARDAFINASRLAGDVRELKVTVETLQRDLEHTKSHNMELDNLLANTRSQRDDALAQVNDWRNRHHALESEHGVLEANHQDLQKAHQELDSNFQQVKRERDEANMEVIRLEDQLAAAKKQIEEFKAHIEGVQRLFTPSITPQVTETKEAPPLPRQDGTLQPRDPDNGHFRPIPRADELNQSSSLTPPRADSPTTERAIPKWEW